MENEILPPKINARAWLSLDETFDNLHPTRIEDTDGKKLTIAAPLTHQGSGEIVVLEAPPQTQKCSLMWSLGSTGYAHQPCRIERSTDGDLPVWQIKLEKQATKVERRAFTRVPEDMNGHIHFADRSVETNVLDISQGGARCQLRSFHVNIEHYSCYIDLVIANFQVLLAANIVHVEDHTDGTMELGIQFSGADSKQDELLKRYIFDRRGEVRDHTDKAS